MGDSDKTPRFRRAPGMDSSQRRRAAAVVIEPIGEEFTSPYDLLEREPSEAAQDLVRRSRRNSEDYLRVGDAAEILLHLDKRLKRADESAQRATVKALEDVRELIAHPPNEAVIKLQAEVASIRDDVAFVRSLRKWAAGSIIGTVITVGMLLWQRSAAEERLRARLEQVERIAEETRQDLRAAARRMNKGTDP